MILSEEQAVAYVYGADAEAIGNAVAFELGLACSRSEGAEALASWALDKADEDPALAAFSGLLDALAWSAVTILHERRRAAA